MGLLRWRQCWLLILLAYLPIAVANTSALQRTELPAFETRVEPYDQIFPAMELARQGVKLKGTRLHQIVVLLSQPAQQELLVTADAQDLFTAHGNIKIGQQRVKLSLQWQLDQLANINLPKKVAIRFSLMDQQKQRSVRWHSADVHASNELLLGMDPAGQKPIDFNWSLATFVDEQSQAAKQILELATASGVVSRFSAYQQADSEEVYAQVFAVWHALQKRGMRYSNLAKAVRAHPALLVQPVRTVQQSFAQKRANCVDGSVLIASALQRAGLRTALVILPGHMLLGISLNQQGSQWIYLETTEMGSLSKAQNDEALAELNEVAESDIRLRQSLRSFEHALARGQQQVDAAGQRFFDPQNVEYQIIDLVQARAKGIAAIRLW